MNSMILLLIAVLGWNNNFALRKRGVNVCKITYNSIVTHSRYEVLNHYGIMLKLVLQTLRSVSHSVMNIKNQL